jgi:hypothetical protein
MGINIILLAGGQNLRRAHNPFKLGATPRLQQLKTDSFSSNLSAKTRKRKNHNTSLFVISLPF